MRPTRIKNDAEYVEPEDMLAELCEDNKALAARLREAHHISDEQSRHRYCQSSTQRMILTKPELLRLQAWRRERSRVGGGNRW